MGIQELSELTGIPVASIKFYVREGLLHPGERLSATRSAYDTSHVRRLELIKALIKVGGLPVAQARAVIEAIDDRELPLIQLMGTAQQAISPTRRSDQPAARRDDAEAMMAALVTDRGWLVSPENPGLVNAIAVLSEAADVMAHGDLAEWAQLVRQYAPVAEQIAEVDLALVARAPDRDQKVRAIVIGTVIGDVLLSALRSMAQEHTARSAQ